MRKD
jgi:hypothetical protein